MELKIPTNKREVRSLLGLLNYYRRFIQNFSTIAQPLTDLTKKASPNKIKWTPEYQVSLDKLKKALTSEPILRVPDPAKPFVVQSDTSNKAIVVKKKDGSNRVCIDYRRLNKITTFDPRPMTPPADVFQGMEKDQYFSKLDLSKGYWQIPVRKEDIPKTAFVTMDCHYEFLRMPFGMMNSGATLTRAVKKLLCGMDNVVDYIDDLLVHTETWEAHVET
ncbi:zinc finger protein [Elysia marginata]|uniref:Zinc finger protein n=1 Tax=Elysia marginata TaxID=1093978 RepID=A0AAV4G3A3_9GAST|nr:zinc finger protein [Elysia marginata]